MVYTEDNIVGVEFTIGIEKYTILENPTIRNKWEVIETPMFSKDRNSILKFL